MQVGEDKTVCRVYHQGFADYLGTELMGAG